MKSRPFFRLAAWASLALLASATADDEARAFPLDRRPTYQTLTAAGLKLLNPLETRGPRFAQQAGLDFRAEPFPLAFTLGGVTSAALVPSDKLSTSFSAADLAPAGKYYPPLPPVQDATPVAYLGFQISPPGLTEARATLASMEKIFQIDMAKVDAWILHRFWESHPTLTLQATVPGGTAEIHLTYSPGPQQEDCKISFSLQWGDPKALESQPPPGVPASHPLPGPPQPVQPPLPRSANP